MKPKDIKIRNILLGLVLSAFSLVFLPACNDGGTVCTTNCSINEPGPCNAEIQEGKGFLVKGDYFRAQDRYFQCLEYYPDNVTGYSAEVANRQRMTAEYGFILAQTLSTLVQVSTSMETLVATAGGLLDSSGLNILQATSPNLNAIVSDIIHGIILKQTDYLRPYLADLKNSPVEPSFLIDDPDTEAIEESIPVYLGKNNEVLWLSLTGELDRGEVELLDSFFAVTQGISETILTINFDVNLNQLIQNIVDLVLGVIAGTPIPINMDLPGEAFDFEYIWSGDTVGVEIVPLVASLAASTLNNSPSFLTLNYSPNLPQGGGPPLLAEAAAKIGEGSAGFISAFDKIRAEGEDANDPFTFVTKDGKENFQLTFLNPAGEKQVIAISARPEFYAAITNIQNSVQANGGTRISWAGDLSWIVSYAAVFLLQTGGVDALMDISVAKISPSLSNQLKGFTQSLPLTPDLIQGVLLSVIPDAIQLDLGYFYHNPNDRYLRNIIPYWTDLKDACGENTGCGYLILEYECPIPTQRDTNTEFPLGATAYMCPEGTITDSGHFANLDLNQKPSETPALPGSIAVDGLLGQMPYLAWQDPTFNHLLWINLGPWCNDCPTAGFAEPGLWEMNYFTIKLIGDLLNMLQSVMGLT